jgi:effector-binding domain-containing protein
MHHNKSYFFLSAAQSECPTICPALRSPVCGTDGDTYSNECFFKAKACLTGGGSLTIEYTGRCSNKMDGAVLVARATAKEFNAPDDCKLFCDAVMDEVCGSDQVTYENSCVLQAHACYERRDLVMKHRGQCCHDDVDCVEEVFDPVCGEDGITYINKCFLQMGNCNRDNKVSVSYVGACNPIEFKIIECFALTVCGGDNKRNAVCGTDGFTYASQCELEAKACSSENDTNLSIDHMGECMESGCRKSCPALMKTICGTDGETYDNTCLMRAKACLMRDAELKVDHIGPCEGAKPKDHGHHGQGHHHGHDQDHKEDAAHEGCPKLCPLIFRPVCGTDSLTYDNECNLHSKACWNDLDIHVANMGPCEMPLIEFIIAEDEDGEDVEIDWASEEGGVGTGLCVATCQQSLLFPVCGSDGKTYGSECELTTTACRKKLDVKLYHIGPCENQAKAAVEEVENKDSIPCPEFCPLYHKPVCGTDGITYSNECKLNSAACSSDKGIVLANAGPCRKNESGDKERQCQTFCPAQYDPVCGSDGKNYANKCKMEIEACQSNVEITIDYLNECEAGVECPNLCQYILSPVCGTDGISYPNECHLRAQVCRDDNTKLRVRHIGECKRAKTEFPERYFKCRNTCTLVYQPVCGTDGKTYSNVCMLHAAACHAEDQTLRVRHKGGCGEDESVSEAIEAKEEVYGEGGDCDKIMDEYRPVCGDDGITYSNKCNMKKLNFDKTEKVSVEYAGTCEPRFEAIEDSFDYKKVCEEKCTTEYRPVCGTDGLTYHNICKLNQAKCDSYVDLRYEGPCDEITFETASIVADDSADICGQGDHGGPVCADNGQTYRNECAMKTEKCKSDSNISLLHDGACEEKDPGQGDCPVICTVQYQPVCGDDGNTYSNKCVMTAKACSTGYMIEMLHKGECENADPIFEGLVAEIEEHCPEICTQHYKPVCGNDKNTYFNRCVMKAKACGTTDKIKILHEGECENTGRVFEAVIVDTEKDCPKICTQHYKPVCGNDGNTYSNKCMMTAKACGTGYRIEMLHKGECENAKPIYQALVAETEEACPEICTQHYKPICGNDGNTYSNKCVMKAKACGSVDKIEILHEGECENTEPVFEAVIVETEDDCPEICTQHYKPVCGDDGNTYSNKCVMKAKACGTGNNIEMLHQGECENAKPVFEAIEAEEDGYKDECAKFCTQEYRPVCGNDGKTYSNKCNMKKTACKEGRKIIVQSNGAC